MYQFNRITLKRPEKRCLLIIAISVIIIIFGHHPLFGKTLEIAVDVWHPYEDISDQQVPGFSTEVITNVFQTMGVKLNLKEYPLGQGIEERL